MKIFLIIVAATFSIVETTELFKLEADSVLVSKLAESAMRAFEVANINELNVVVDNFTTKTSDVVENCIKLISGKCVVLNSEKIFAKTTLMILENEKFLQKSRFKNFLTQTVHEFFMILFLNESSIDEENIFGVFLKHHVLNVNLLLMNSNGAIKITTFIPFTENECGSVRSKVINTYDFDKSTWANREIFPKKVDNLQKCPLRISSFDSPPAVIVRTSNGNETYSGHDFELIQGLAEMINFTLSVQILKENYAWGFIMENGSSGGVMKKVIDQEADIGIGFYYLTQTRAKFMSFSEYSSSKIVLVVPPGRKLSAFEKLFSPFSYFAWIAILFSILFGLIVIFIVRRQKKSIQHFVFGTRTRNPYINILDIFLNGSQTVQPNRNFSRFLVTIFVLYCIIIRTLYQAALFQFLQTEQKHGEIQTVDEILEKEFDIFMYSSFQELSNGLKIHQR